jgi:hypothetical protein
LEGVRFFAVLRMTTLRLQLMAEGRRGLFDLDDDFGAAADSEDAGGVAFVDA